MYGLGAPAMYHYLNQSGCVDVRGMDDIVEFKDVENFFATMPKLTHTVKVTNPHTKVESDVVLEGLAAFFS